MLREHQLNAMLYMVNEHQMSPKDAALLYGVTERYVKEQLAAPAAGVNHPMSNKEHPMPAQLRAVEKVRPEHMSLYPTMDSCPEAIAYIEQQAPLNTPTEIFSALMMYHNTLLKQLNDTGQLKN